jgi:2-alkyl-3-oxoalkanoate reductase
MKVFVTGATGVIGRRVIPLLIQRGHEVTGASRSVEKSAELALMGAEPVQLDLFDLDKLKAAVKRHDAVINLATAIPPSSTALIPFAWRENSRVRRYISANVAAAAKHAGVGRLVQESFAPIYASAGDQWLIETSPIKPARYNRAVVDAERAAAGFAETGGKAVVLRFAFFYGPDSDFTLDIVQMVRKGWAPLLGSPDGYISSVTHDDAARAVVSVLTAPSGLYNVSDDDPLRKREFYETLAHALRVRPPKYPPSWLWRVLGSVGETLSRSQRVSNQKLRSIGWAPKYPSAREGWKDLVRSKV